MPPPPISVPMTRFAQIEILRDEIEKFRDVLKKTEEQIREILYQQQRQDFLQTVHAAFREMPMPENSQNLQKLLAHREVLYDALEKMEAALGALEPQAGLPSAARPAESPLSSSAGAARRQRFDSFDDFRAKEGGKKS